MIVLDNCCQCGISLVSFIIFYCLPLASTNESKYEDNNGRLDINIVDVDQNIAKVCDRLRKLDNILTRMYIDLPVDGGEELMRLSRTYNQACLDLLYLCTFDKHKSLKAAEDIIEFGGPKFLEIDIDEKKMEERFKWKEVEMDGMYITRKKTNEHWYDLWHMYNSLP